MTQILGNYYNSQPSVVNFVVLMWREWLHWACDVIECHALNEIFAKYKKMIK